MRRDDDALRAILDRAQAAGVLVARAGTEDGLRGDPIFQHAAASILITVGEAVGRLSKEIRERHPEIPWSEIKGARNVIAHGYDTIDWGIAWTMLERDVPSLADGVREILETEFPEADA